MGEFIFEFPQVSVEQYFTYDAMQFVIGIVAVILGFLLCIWGYKYMSQLLILLFGGLIGLYSLRIIATHSDNSVLQMWLYVLFTFTGICVVILAVILFNTLLKKLKLRDKFNRIINVTSGIIGAFIISYVLYTRVYNGTAVIIAVFLVISLISIFYQHKEMKKQMIFHNYDDIIKEK